MDSLVAKNLHDAYLNREMAWLTFARRVLALAEDETTPLMERIKFAGIMGMLYDEFAMKRLGGLYQRIAGGKLAARAPDGLSAPEELRLCREELSRQIGELSTLIEETLRPALALEGFPLLRIAELSAQEQAEIDAYFRQSVLPILTPLAADLAHPFPFVSNQSLNLAVLVRDQAEGSERFVRVKLPTNRPRWVPIGRGWLALEDLIANHVGDLFPEAAALRQYMFRVLRGAKDSPWDRPEARELSSDTKREFAEWIDRQGWETSDQTEKQRKRLGEEVRIVAHKLLERQDKRIMKLGKGADQDDPAAMHRLRIECKKLRYATEFFYHLFDGMDSFVEHMKGLQDVLGAMHDIAVMGGMIDHLMEGRTEPELRRYADELVRWRAHENEAKKQAFGLHWRDFTDARRPWRHVH
jgi:polyphosphate kinase